MRGLKEEQHLSKKSFQFIWPSSRREAPFPLYGEHSSNSITSLNAFTLRPAAFRLCTTEQKTHPCICYSFTLQSSLNSNALPGTEGWKHSLCAQTHLPTQNHSWEIPLAVICYQWCTQAITIISYFLPYSMSHSPVSAWWPGFHHKHWAMAHVRYSHFVQPFLQFTKAESHPTPRFWDLSESLQHLLGFVTSVLLGAVSAAQLKLWSELPSTENLGMLQ